MLRVSQSVVLGDTSTEVVTLSPVRAGSGGEVPPVARCAYPPSTLTLTDMGQSVRLSAPQREVRATAGDQLRVSDVLALEPLRRGLPEILSGESRLDQLVRWVHVGEQRFIASLLREGDLLLTTGMGLPTDAAARAQFIDDLADRGVVGTVIELGAVIPEMPPEMVGAAQRRDFPLVALHRQIPFTEVTELAHARLIGIRQVEMEHAEVARRRFHAALLEYTGVRGVLDALEEVVRNPVMLEQHGRGLVAHLSSGFSDAALFGAWEACRRQDPGAPAMETAKIRLRAHEREPWGTLYVLAMNNRLERLDTLVVERAADAISLAINWDSHHTSMSLDRRSAFLAAILDSNQTDLRESVLIERAADLGFGRQSPWLLPIVLTDPESAVTDERQSAVDLQVWRSVRERLERANVPSLAGFVGAGREMAIVVGIRSEDERAATAQTLATLIGTTDSRQTVVAVGPAARRWHDLRECFAETREAAIAARFAPHRPWHDATAPDIDRLLWSLKDSPQVRTFVRRRIGAVVEHDRSYDTHLLDTLVAFCEHGGNITETAAALFVRRQSLYKRLQKLETLLGGPVTSADVRLGVELALRLRVHM